jgi:hypothetical protein
MNKQHTIDNEYILVHEFQCHRIKLSSHVLFSTIQHVRYEHLYHTNRKK